MPRISGILNAYFPFELKESSALSNINRVYENTRSWLIKKNRHLHRPRTDMMDVKIQRDQIEDIVAWGQKLMGGTCVKGSEPYANRHIASAYHKYREDNLFVKEASVLISEFNVVCKGVNDSAPPMQGRLYYFNNLSNHVGTYLLAIQFENRTVDEVIRLKHAFYKRAKVNIMESSVHTSIGKENKDTTFQQYVCEKAQPQGYRRKTDIDFRARYTFLEITHNRLNDVEVYGLLTANEKYPFVLLKKGLKDYSEEFPYSLYYDLRSALLVNHFSYSTTLKRQRDFFGQLKFGQDQIPIEIMPHDNFIAGLEKSVFPLFLKSVELHFLTNNALVHETERHERSYWIPHIFIKRMYKIWKILNELDISNCFIDSTMLESFGVEEDLKKLRAEYTLLTSHLINFSILVLTFFMLLKDYIIGKINCL